MRIVEQINFDYYDDEDFLDAFFQIFRTFISKNYGSKILNYPMSYLLKNYSASFISKIFGEDGLKEILGYEEGDNLDELKKDYIISRWEAKSIAKRAVEQGKYFLPKPFEAKLSDNLMSSLRIFIDEDIKPKYARIKFEEPNPQQFKIDFEVNFEDWIKDENRVEFVERGLVKKLKSFMKNYLGVEFGSLKYGQAELDFNVNILGASDWKKNVLNKKIKEEFKKMPESIHVKSIKFDSTDDGAYLELTYFNSTNYTLRNHTLEKYRNKLNELGYGPNLILTNK